MRLRPSTWPSWLHRTLHWLTPLGAIVGLFLFNLRLRGRLRKTALSALFVLPAGAAAESPALYHAMDQFWGNTPWDQRENFVWRGGSVHLTQELLRSIATRQPPPKADDVSAAIDRRRAAAGLPPISGPGAQW